MNMIDIEEIGDRMLFGINRFCKIVFYKIEELRENITLQENITLVRLSSLKISDKYFIFKYIFIYIFQK